MLKLFKGIDLSSVKSVYVYVIPFGILVWFVMNYGTNVPFMDQWGLVPIFKQLPTGDLGFTDLMRQNNEHRLLIPTAIFTLMAFLTDWNIWYELFLNIILTFITFSAVCFIAKQVYTASNALSLCLLVCGLLLCSLIQYDNWLHGFQVAFFLIQACVALAVLVLSLEQWSELKRVLIAGLLCFVASLSSGHGLLSWIALTPLILTMSSDRRTTVKYTFVWLLLLLGTYGLYFYEYVSPTGEFIPDKTFFLKHPIEAMQFFLVLQGSQFAHSFHLDPVSAATVLGLVISITYVFLTIYYSLNRRFNEQKSFIVLGLFGLLCSAMNTVGRSAWGPPLALTSRYTTTPIYVFVSVILMLLGLFTVTKKQYVVPLISGFLIAVIFSSSGYALTQAQEVRSFRQHGELCLEFMRVVAKVTDQTEHSCITKLYHVLPERAGSGIRAAVDDLDSLGFRHVWDRVRLNETPAENWGVLRNTNTSKQPIILKKSDVLELSGWAVVPGRNEVPRAVGITYGNTKRFLTVVPVNLVDKSVAAYLKNPSYRVSGWSAKIPMVWIPFGETEIKAWAYDDRDNQFVKIYSENEGLRIQVVR